MEEQANVIKYMKLFKLNKRQVLFAIRFDGNATATARRVGYANPSVAGSRLLANDRVVRLLDRLTARQSGVDSQSKLLTRNDLMAIWSELASDTSATWKDRLKAMDSLAKSQGIFIDRSQIISNVRVESLDRLTDRELIAELDDVLAKLSDAGVSLNIPKQITERTTATE